MSNTKTILFLISLSLFLPLIGKALENNNTISDPDTLLADQYFQKAFQSKTSAHYDSSLVYFEKAMAIYEEAAQWAKYVESLNLMGDIYIWTFNDKLLMEVSEKALFVGLKYLGDDHPQIGFTYMNIGYKHYHTGEYEKSWDYYKKAMKITMQSLGDKDPQMADIYIKAGFYHSHKGNFDQHLIYLNKALDIFRQSYGEEHPKTAHTYDCLGFYYNSIGDYDRVISNSKKGLAIKLKILGADHPDLAMNYNNMGVNYGKKGDYHNKLDYLQKALDILMKSYGEDNDFVSATYGNMGDAYGKLGDFDKELQFLTKASNILIEKYSEVHPGVDINYIKIGNCYKSKGDFTEAIKYLEKALSLNLKIRGEENNYLSSVFDIMGQIYSEQGQHEKALGYYQKVYDVRKKIYGEQHPEVALALNNIGGAYKKVNEIDQALKYYQNALDIQLKVLGPSPPNLINSYHDIGEIYLQKKEYATAINYFEKALSGLDQMKRNHLTDRAKQFHLEDKYVIFENAILSQWKAALGEHGHFDLKQAFLYAEKSKDNLLHESLNIANAETFAGIPDSLLEKEHHLRIRIAYYEKKRFEELGNGIEKNDSINRGYLTKAFDLKEQYIALIDQFEKDYPDYYRLKYNTDVVSVGHVQNKLLQSDQTLLEYFVGDSSIFVFLIQAHDFKVFHIEKDFPLEEWVDQMRKGLYYYQMSGVTDENSYLTYSKTFALASSQLYQKLIAPFKADLSEKLIIIPDEVLSYIPFEALLMQLPETHHEFKSHAYLLRDHQISYNYSASLLEEMTNKNKKASKFLLAFAPTFSKNDQLIASVDIQRSELGALEYNIPEVQQISNLLGGDIFTGDEATKDNFTQLAGKYQILHLATHGKANDKMGDYSFLAFTEIKDSLENERLYVRDLYNLKLNADLVVLSACETGIGELQKGEGVISLARGFSYAGAKSMLTTLWSVNDKTTKEIMGVFYRNIKSGMDKDAAIREAKLAYIDQHSHLGAHPYYWAGFVPFGNMAHVQLERSWLGTVKYGFIGLGLLLFLYWFFKSKAI